MARHNLAIIDDQKEVPLSKEDRDMLHKALSTMLRVEKIDEAVEVSLILVSESAIHELNRQYRGQDKPTDVLSFATKEQGGDGAAMRFILPEKLSHHPLGDIVIAPRIALFQAEAMGHTLQQELVFLAVHGLLHLLGYDHGDTEQDAGLQEMLLKQEQILVALGMV